jgi:hypothetical protein
VLPPGAAYAAGRARPGAAGRTGGWELGRNAAALSPGAGVGPFVVTAQHAERGGEQGGARMSSQLVCGVACARTTLPGSCKAAASSAAPHQSCHPSKGVHKSTAALPKAPALRTQPALLVIPRVHTSRSPLIELPDEPGPGQQQPQRQRGPIQAAPRPRRLRACARCRPRAALRTPLPR